MLERLIIAVVISLAGVALWCAYNRLSVRRAASVAQHEPVLEQLQQGVATILYFTTPFCEPCRTLQQPTLAQLEQELGPRLKVIKIDATEQPDVADRWGVFSAPTTFVLDEHQQPRHVNRGVASAETLKKQLGLVS
ncbi:MAG: thioredoxin family protein [Anaerolineae bacterium]|nr:thioredoxin family protein [Anaerolineae bacterium]